MSDRSRSNSGDSQKENTRPKFVPLATPLVSVRETKSPWGTATKYAKYSAPTRKNGGKKNRKTQRKLRKTRHKRR
jgi:hypothetical protein